MSDEYASTGYKGSLVNSSNDPKEKVSEAVEYGTGNYPQAGDSTSSGGYGSSIDPYSAPAQRGHLSRAPSFPDDSSDNLVDQSIPGGPAHQTQDAQQGQDLDSRKEFSREQGGLGGQGLDPYGTSSLESRREGEEALAGRYRGARDRVYEGGGGLGNDQDLGA